MRLLALIFCLMLALSGCGTTAGNPGSENGNMSLVDVKVDQGQVAALFAVQPAQVQLKICFDHMSFVSPSGELSGIPLGPVTRALAANSLTTISAGADLGTYSTSAQSFQSVKIPLSTNCTAGHTVEITRPDGAFATTDAMSMEFDGPFDLSNSSTANVSLNFSSVLSALSTVSKSEDLKPAIEDNHGKGSSTVTETKTGAPADNGNGHGNNGHVNGNNGNGNGNSNGHGD